MTINTNDDNTILVCKYCDLNDIRYTTGEFERADRGWYCEQCQRPLDKDELDEREKHCPGQRHGLAGKLADMDPDDL